MKFGEIGVEQAVLDGGEDLVADVFVERHTAAQCIPALGHAGAEDGVGLACEERQKEIGQPLRGILPVAMDERNDVETLFDRVVKADLLVAAVALVDGVEKDG